MIQSIRIINAVFLQIHKYKYSKDGSVDKLRLEQIVVDDRSYLVDAGPSSCRAKSTRIS